MLKQIPKPGALSKNQGLNEITCWAHIITSNYLKNHFHVAYHFDVLKYANLTK